MDQLKRLDYAVYRAERWFVAAALLLMAVVVFLDVVHRGFAGEDSKFAEVGIKVAGLFGLLPAKDAPERLGEAEEMRETLKAASPYVLFTVFSCLGYFGIRSARRAEPVAPPTAALYAIAGVLAAYGLIRLLIWGMPNGLIWSQPMALILTLWVGFIGASMCTYESKHLRVEAVQRHIPERYRPMIGFLSGLLTTLVCLLLFWVSLRYVLFNYDEYVQTQGRGGLVQGWEVPKWQGFLALPTAFAVMTARFGARAVLALQGKLEEPDALGLNKPQGTQLPSEVETEAVRASNPSNRVVDGPPAPSEIDTMTSHSSGRGSAPPPSKVATDPHQVARREQAAADARAAAGEPLPTAGEGPVAASGRISSPENELVDAGAEEEDRAKADANRAKVIDSGRVEKGDAGADDGADDAAEEDEP